MKIFVLPDTPGFWWEDEAPEGALEITEEWWQQLLTEQSNGKIIDFSVYPPQAVEYVPPEPTVEQKKAAIRVEKATRLEEAERQIAVLERAVRKGKATPEQKARLDAWENYSISIDQIDTSQLNIFWPEKPEV